MEKGDLSSLIITLDEGRKLKLRRDDVHNVLIGNQKAAQVWEIPNVPEDQSRLEGVTA
jgi:hypothetical protein